MRILALIVVVIAPGLGPAQGEPLPAGTVRGRVTWAGEKPAVLPLPAALPSGPGYKASERPNPFAPQISTDGGLGGVVVSLAGVKPDNVGKSRRPPWPPVTVVHDDFRIRVKQGDGEPAGVGLVWAGDEVTVVSKEPVPASVRFRGAAYFTLPFPDANKPLRRKLDQPGWVELSSGSLFYWAAADLLVADHPYHAVTDANGRFELTNVPPGKYELIVRVRDWRVAGVDRDPETGLIYRQRYKPERFFKQAVTVPAGGAAEVTVPVPAADFQGR
ncbi:MAG: hypothetical protein U0871_23440 [Gemmataceae bacterium]